MGLKVCCSELKEKHFKNIIVSAYETAARQRCISLIKRTSNILFIDVDAAAEHNGLSILHHGIQSPFLELGDSNFMKG